MAKAYYDGEMYPVAVPIGMVFDFERKYGGHVVRKGDFVFNGFPTDGTDGILNIYYVNKDGFDEFVKENEHSETDTGNS